VNLEVWPGERLVVLGQSGGGKSTILRLILNILTPTRGRVLFKGRDLAHVSRRRLNRARQKIGMIYQYSALISSLSVRDNLALALEELTDEPRAEIDQRVRKNLERVGMLDSLEKMPAELSGGMRKRVGLARGLMNEPELLLYDEPTAGLDPVTRGVVDELIIALSEQTGAASVVVTHEMESAFKVATRMAMLYEGTIIADGDPESFHHHENPVVAQFVSGSAQGPIKNAAQ
jgi:phospholipid/cholesterol/gamma-HCH transport system ATP-binding protein